MSALNNYDALKQTLNKVFQLDQADLDFGIYRIMNQKREEIENFLDNDLLPQVKEVIGGATDTDTTALQTELEKLTQTLRDVGAAPESSSKYLELKAQLDATPDTKRLEEEVFSLLTNFLRRYYDKGDFISQRRYKEGVYAIPYAGEEVKLHWANHDQYYIKTAEYLKNYAFKVAGGRRVRFELTDASTEQNNNKTAAGKYRYFRLNTETPVAEIDGELVLYFSYQPCDQKDKQTDLNAAAVETLKTKLPKAWIADLLAPKPTEKQKDRTLLLQHLNSFTARNTFDYFIHKDLGGFLERELDFFIKNEVLHLDDIDYKKPDTMRVLLTRVQALKTIARKIIRFLAQLEDFQKRLWLKRKFVLATHYCITLDRIPESYHAEIAANDAQWAEWEELFKLSVLEDDLFTATGDRATLLKNQPYLVLDTKFFSPDFKYRLLSEFEDLDAETDGLLINSENFQALRLLEERYRGEVDTVYIDPPYNTEQDRAQGKFIYKDGFADSSWVTMISNRQDLLSKVLSSEFAYFQSISREELDKLILLNKDCQFLKFQGIFSWKRTRTGGQLSNSYNQLTDYIVVSTSVDNQRLFGGKADPEESQPLTKAANNRKDLTFPAGSIRFKDFPEGTILNNTSGNSTNPVVTRSDVKVVKSYNKSQITLEGPFTWGQENLDNEIDRGATFIIKKSENLNVRFFRESPHHKPFPSQPSKSFTVGTNEDGSDAMVALFGRNISFSYPKPIALIERIVEAKAHFNNNSTTLDYFAGSGTTAHAVINLNREDGGQRKYILVEMGTYFNTVTKPRIQKVVYSADWKDGTPVSRKGSSQLMKYLQLESYEDTLNNLTVAAPTEATGKLLENAAFREDYLLGYTLDLSTRDSLLTVTDFQRPFDYQLDITEDDEPRPTAVDLVETFNYLIGLRVKTIKSVGDFRVVTGTRPDGKSALVIWRTIEDAVVADDALRELFTGGDYAGNYDVVYVNGDNTLASLREDADRWEVLLTEREFLRRMFS